MIGHEAILYPRLHKIPDVSPVLMLEFHLIGKRVDRAIRDRDFSFLQFLKNFGLVNVHGVLNRDL